MGRWSRRLAPLLVRFAGVSDGDRVLDVGSGTGALAAAVARAAPSSRIVGIDPSAPYVAFAQSQHGNARIHFEVGDAQRMRFEAARFDVAMSLLVVNFIPDARKALDEMKRVTRQGGTIAAAVWDYADGMEMLRMAEETLTIATRFTSFDDFWAPFLEKQGPAGAYAASLTGAERETLPARLRKRLLGDGPDKPITMQARAWAVRGTVR